MAGVIINGVLDVVGKSFPDKTIENVRNLVEHQEAGLALEVLCSEIFEYEIELSEKSRDKLKFAAQLMGINSTSLDGLADPPLKWCPFTSHSVPSIFLKVV